MKSWFHRTGVPTFMVCVPVMGAMGAAACSQQSVDPSPIGPPASGASPGAGGSLGAGGSAQTMAGQSPGSGAVAAGGTPIVPLPTAGANTAGAPSAPSTCSAEFADTGLEPVYLAFAFDVSGSMGKGDEPYHNVELKWKPVVSATKAFFSDPSSSKISASLSFFPAKEDKCEAATYEAPDVNMTALPSNAFADAIDAITPQSSSDWRGGTPTLAVMAGVASFIRKARSELGSGKFAMVLVSDGYPQGCDDDEDSIDAVAEQVGSVAADFPTYVIGVANPEGGPDTVSNLKRIAEAGGTQDAFLIKTGDPEQTSRDFKAVIDAIRGNSLSCQAAIPTPPDGSTLERDKVNVSYTSDAGRIALAYDPGCQERSAWRYDDPQAPTRIELCDQACADVQASPNVKLSVEFGCATRPVVPR